MSLETDPETGLPVDDLAGEESPGPGAGAPEDFNPDDHALLEALSEVPHPDDKPLAGTLTPPDISLSSPLESPGAAPQETKTGSRVSAAQSGITAAGTKRAGGIFGAVEAAGDPERKRLADELEANKASQADYYAKAKAALAAETAANEQHYKELSAIQADEITHFKTVAEAEALAQVAAHAEGAKYIDNYKQEMVAVRQLMQQSGNPLGDLSGTTKMGLAAAAFAQGFLGSRGIKIDVNGQIDRWVDREIAEHHQKVADLKGVAEGNLTLYGIARQGAQDDWEARQRLRGFKIDELKSRTMLEASRWGSEAATAAAMAKTAELDSLQTANTMALQNRFTDTKQKMYTAETTRAADMARASIESRKASVDAENQRRLWAKDDAARANKGAEPEYQIRVIDPGAEIREGDKVVGAKEMWVEKKGLPKEIRDQGSKVATEESARYAAVRRAMDILRPLRAPAQPSGILSRPQMERFNEDVRTYKKAVSRAVMQARHEMSGAQLTPDERKEWDSLFELNSKWQSGDNDSVLDDYEKSARDRFTSVMNSNPAFEAVDESVAPATIKKYATNANETEARYKAAHKPEAPVSAVKLAEAAPLAEGHNEAKRPGYSPFYASYLRASGKPSRMGEGANLTGGAHPEVGQTGEIDGVDHLAVLWASSAGDTTAQSEVTDALLRIAGKTSRADHEVKEYATAVYNRLTSGAADPADVKSIFGQRLTGDVLGKPESSPADGAGELKLR